MAVSSCAAAAPDDSAGFVRASGVLRRGLFAGLLGVGLALLAACDAAPPAAPEWRILPEQRGRVESVVLSLSSGRRAALRNADIVSRLVDALPPEVEVRILTNDRGAFEVRQPAAPRLRRSVEFVSVAADRELTIWPQDPFLVLESPTQGIRLLRSNRFERADDRLMAEAVGRATGIPVVPSSLVFEGGNLVADEQRVFVGANTIRRNALELGISDPAAAQRFENELGRRVVVVGPLPQLLAHLDLFLTPIGDDRVVVADPRWGARVARRALEADPRAGSSFEDQIEAWFFGDPRVERIEASDRTLERPDLSGGTARAIEDSLAAAPAFDALAAALSRRGLRVERVPMLLVESAMGLAAAASEESGRERPYAASLDFPILTYNNVVQDERDGVSQVWLPQYGLEPLDAAARTAWQALGRRVVPIAGYATSALYGGALRCTTKVVRRSARDG